MSQKAESLLKSWKGAQAILELPPLPRYVILTLICAFGLFISSFIFTGYFIPILTGVLGGGFFVYISILSFNVAISRDREEKRRKTSEEQVELIRKMFEQEGSKITEESMRKFITIFLSVADKMFKEVENKESKHKEYEPFNDVWKDRIMKALDSSEIELQLRNLKSRMDARDLKDKESEQLWNKNLHTQNKEDEQEK